MAGGQSERALPAYAQASLWRLQLTPLCWVQTLSVITAISLLAPIAGLGFAWWSYGTLWG